MSQLPRHSQLWQDGFIGGFSDPGLEHRRIGKTGNPAKPPTYRSPRATVLLRNALLRVVLAENELTSSTRDDAQLKMFPGVDPRWPESPASTTLCALDPSTRNVSKENHSAFGLDTRRTLSIAVPPNSPVVAENALGRTRDNVVKFLPTPFYSQNLIRMLHNWTLKKEAYNEYRAK